MNITIPINNHTFTHTGHTITRGAVRIIQPTADDNYTIDIYDIDTGTWDTVTENNPRPGIPPQLDHAHIKDYGAHEGVWRDLVALDVIDHPTNRDVILEGHRVIQYARPSLTVLGIANAVARDRAQQ